jgi:hypothetical protein
MPMIDGGSGQKKSPNGHGGCLAWSGLAMMLLAICTAACAPTLMKSNSAGGVIGMNFNMSQQAALNLADRECAKSNKVARSEGVNELRNSLRYTCVAP